LRTFDQILFAVYGFLPNFDIAVCDFAVDTS
jgi:hypothetical protein